MYNFYIFSKIMPFLCGRLKKKYFICIRIVEKPISWALRHEKYELKKI